MRFGQFVVCVCRIHVTVPKPEKASNLKWRGENLFREGSVL